MLIHQSHCSRCWCTSHTVYCWLCTAHNICTVVADAADPDVAEVYVVERDKASEPECASSTVCTAYWNLCYAEAEFLDVFENSQDYAQNPQRKCTFMNSASGWRVRREGGYPIHTMRGSKLGFSFHRRGGGGDGWGGGVMGGGGGKKKG
jgi:hypothetical protein